MGTVGVPRTIALSHEDWLVWQDRGDGTVEILDIAVNSGRREGKGRRMLELLFAQVPPETQTVYAITRADNLIAQRFYEATCFECTAVLRRFYSRAKPQVDAVMYGRSPKGPV